MSRAPAPGVVKRILTSEERDRLRASWQYRLLIAAEDAEKRNGEDRLFRILTAALRLPTDRPPWLGPSAIVLEDGVVCSNFVSADGVSHGPTAVCTLDDLVGNLRNLLEEIHFSQAEAEAVFGALRVWITHDNRPERKEEQGAHNG